jgi:hypothetical protein
MNPTRAFHSTSFRRRLTFLAILAIACAPGAARARDAGWHVELGFNGRLRYGFSSLSDVVDREGGADIDVHIVRRTGGLGVRLESGFGGLKEERADILGLLWLQEGPTPQLVTFGQSLDWWAVGPSWSFPLRRGRVDVYVLGGSAYIDRYVSTPEYGSGYFAYEPTWVYGLPKGGESAEVPIFIAGTSWSGGRVRVWRLGFGAEIGCELQVAGKGVIWDHPPVALDGSQYLPRTRSVTMSAAALRLGINYVGWMRKR